MTKIKQDMEEYEERLIGLISEIDKQIPISIDNQILITMQLNTFEKAQKFARWVGTKLDDQDRLHTTEIEIMNITARIKHGRELP